MFNRPAYSVTRSWDGTTLLFDTKQEAEAYLQTAMREDSSEFTVRHKAKMIARYCAGRLEEFLPEPAVNQEPAVTLATA